MTQQNNPEPNGNMWQAPQQQPQGTPPAPSAPQHQQYPHYPAHPPVGAGPAKPKPPRNNMLLGVVIGLGIGLVGGGALGFVTGIAAVAPGTGTASSDVLSQAVETCGLSSAEGISLGDNGQSINIDVKGAEDLSGADMIDAACVLNETGIPDYVVSQVDSTRALDGTKEAKWNGLAASWSYHPDSGMDMTIHVVNE